MRQINVLINSPEKANDFIRIIQSYNCDFDLESGQGCVDAKSLIGVMSLNLKKDARLSIHADEQLAGEVVHSLKKFIVEA